MWHDVARREVRNDMQDMARFVMVARHDMRRYMKTGQDKARYGKTWQDVARHGTTWQDASRCDVRNDMARYGKIC